MGANWTLLRAVPDILTALSFFTIFLALILVAARREVAKYRVSPLVFALFVLFAGLGRILSLSGAARFQDWWNLVTAILAAAAAGIVIANLPRYLRMPKIAAELRRQACFLEEQQALLQAIQDSVSDGLMLIGEDGRIAAFNAAALHILWGQDEHKSKPLPEMKERAIQALAKGQSDRDVVRWEGRSIERFTTGVPGYGRLYVFRDITARRQLEEQRLRLERVVASMKEGFAIVSFDTLRIVSTNPAMDRMLGYEKNELAGSCFSEVQAGSGEERQAAVENIRRTVSLSGFWEGEIRNRRKDGGELIVHATVSLSREAEATYFSCIQVDVTGQKLLQEEKDRLQQKLMQTQRLESLGRLARGVGHEFNNLLTGIMGNAGLALDRLPPGAPISAMLEDIVSASERAAAVSRQLLAFSGLPGPFASSPIDLSALIEDLAGLAKASISKDVQLQIELDRTIPLVEADAGQIRQVLLNLIANGAEAIGGASGVVRVTTGVTEIDSTGAPDALGAESIARGRYVYLEVHDNGGGMDREIQSNIFDPFFTTKAPGRGLGLAAVLGIVRGHNGAIKVHSIPGKGSTVRVLLPAAKARTPLAVAPDRVHGKGVILIVEDEPIVRRTTLAVLSHHGFEVRAAENGLIGVEMFREMADQVSLVLLDLAMPVMGGEEALRRIREIAPDVPVVITSGHNEADMIERFSTGGVNGVLEKPYTARQLVDRLQAVLEQRSVTHGG